MYICTYMVEDANKLKERRRLNKTKDVGGTNNSIYYGEEEDG